MVATVEPQGAVDDEQLLTPDEIAVDGAVEETVDGGARELGRGPEPGSLRPLVASGLATAAAALVVGGVFDSWAARLFSLAVAAAGTALAAWTQRSRRPALAQVLVPLFIVLAALFSVLPGGSPGDLRRLVGDAVDAARLLQIPIPFDAGWRPLLVLIFGFLGFGSATVGVGLKKPMLGVVLPVPLVALAAISQPTSQQVTAGILAFLPILAAFGVLFGGDDAAPGSGGLGRQFELTRLLRGAAGMVALAVGLVVLGHTSFLFPKPAYDPNDKPQKPKSIPLSQQRDRVLFTVKAPPGFVGPWRTNVLDVYEDGAWKLPASGPGRLDDLPANGRINRDATPAASIDVTITTGDLGPTAVMPVVPSSQTVRFPNGRPDLKVDVAAGTLKVPAGRAPSGFTYTLSLAPYPSATALGQVQKVTPDATHLGVPAAPIEVQRLLAQAPPGPWARLDFVRHQLLDHVTASGAGSSRPVTAARVVDLLSGSKKGTPFEIVAAEALLSRWAGVPSRIGTGFSGVNDEGGVLTVRPKNAEQWLEVRIDGYGWIPLLDVPPQAEANLDSKDKDDERILPSKDIAAQLYVPVEVSNPRLLFEQVRSVLLEVSPFLLAILLAVLLAPIAARAVRRQRRERWAEGLGARARIAVAYAELRDAATDLSVGDPFATPIEFLDRVQEDGEHRELAWLVTRALYGDLAYDATDEDAMVAEEMAASMARRLRAAQPMQVRAVASVSRASLLQPFSDELPNVRLPRPLRTARLAVVRAAGAPGRALRRRRGSVRPAAEEVVA